MATTDLVRRDPFMTPFRQVMDRFFDDPFFRNAFPIRDSADGEDGSLALDVFEQDGHLIVEASLPGFSKDEVDVQVHDGILAIKAQRSSEREEGKPGSHYYRRERSWGSVSRRVALPGIVKDEDVSAELKNGVLRLAIPLPQKPSPKQIEIKGE
ncbi:MAG: Hsp20/alpha crystallin family protein [Dehalococcoidia bacterium]|nr:Hsp20/alpha crystallin family protein [Dehalococcoidia bacterium]